MPLGIGAEFNNEEKSVKRAILGLQEKYLRNATTQLCRVGCTCACTDAASCVSCAYVSFLSAFVSILSANLSISACVERDQYFYVWVEGSACQQLLLSLYFYVCLSAKLPVRRVFRSHRSLPKGSPQRELRSPSISVGICDCQRSDKMPPGQCSVLRQAGILHCTDECCLEALSRTKAALLKLNTSA